eukprot:TRINITY_DN16970_c0_g1_i1.p1 TRINITY_DN16970_c0_g1~~TRINITY_DN16970_c0_g1_i1.p1  ORF type:complete len:188 (+),score=46.74 TRINITY_DN16970_c0_g1_i1:362-925(+)
MPGADGAAKPPPFDQAPAPGSLEDGIVGRPEVAGQPPAGAAPSADSALPAPPSGADRLRRVKLVASALSEDIITKLKSLSVPLSRGRSDGISKLVEAGVSAVSQEAQCSRLGLLSPGSLRSKLPPPLPGPPRLPACTLSLAHSGLWERFRQRCGTPLPSEPQPVPCEVKASKGGGNVVVPLCENSGS